MKNNGGHINPTLISVVMSARASYNNVFGKVFMDIEVV